MRSAPEVEVEGEVAYECREEDIEVERARADESKIEVGGE